MLIRQPSTFYLALSALLALAPASAAQGADAEQPTAEALVSRMDDLYDSSGTVAEVEVEIVEPDKTRIMKLRMWSRGEDESLAVVLEPSRDEGTATLRIDRNIWNYLPKISRTIRVPPSMMMGSWMGTDLTYDDLVKESSFVDDYTHELVGRSDDPPGWLVRMTARPGTAGLWSRIDVVFTDQHRLPAVALYYDRRDELARTMRFEDVRTMDGRLVPTRLVVVPEDEKGERTVFRYNDIRWNAELDDDLFSLRRLERRS
ncbi:MAG: outer membrane lipoprotein-sorting protein [Candidatus Eisenbacteria bacterium]|nr:outer membrane lipoprotein-sorting protein [Candidatus Eisenbacteria bacterium]